MVNPLDERVCALLLAFGAREDERAEVNVVDPRPNVLDVSCVVDTVVLLEGATVSTDFADCDESCTLDTTKEATASQLAFATPASFARIRFMLSFDVLTAHSRGCRCGVRTCLALSDGCIARSRR